MLASLFMSSPEYDAAVMCFLNYRYMFSQPWLPCWGLCSLCDSDSTSSRHCPTLMVYINLRSDRHNFVCVSVGTCEIRRVFLVCLCQREGYMDTERRLCVCLAFHINLCGSCWADKDHSLCGELVLC